MERRKTLLAWPWLKSKLRETVEHYSLLKIRPAVHSRDGIAGMNESFQRCFNRDWKNILLCRGWSCRSLRCATQICAAVGSSKENRQCKLLTNMGWTMDCPSQAGKLIRGIGWRELGLLWNSATQTLAACTQMRIRQHATACASHWFDLAWSKTWTKDCSRHARDSTADATRTDSWGCQVSMQNVG